MKPNNYYSVGNKRMCNSEVFLWHEDKPKYKKFYYTFLSTLTPPPPKKKKKFEEPAFMQVPWEWQTSFSTSIMNVRMLLPVLSHVLAFYDQIMLTKISCTTQPFIRPIYIGKNQNPKKLFFFFCCCTVYTARKTHNIRGFWHEKRMRKKNLNLILFFLVSGAHARLLSTFDRT